MLLNKSTNESYFLRLALLQVEKVSIQNSWFNHPLIAPLKKSQLSHPPGRHQLQLFITTLLISIKKNSGKLIYNDLTFWQTSNFLSNWYVEIILINGLLSDTVGPLKTVSSNLLRHSMGKSHCTLPYFPHLKSVVREFGK